MTESRNRKALFAGQCLDHAEKRRHKDITVLAQEAWIWSPRRRHSRTCNQPLRLCQQAGFEPHIMQSAHQFHAGVSLVASGVGIMVTEVWTRGQQLMLDRVAYRPLKDVTWHVDLQMLWRSNEKKTLVEEFLRVAREASIRLAKEGNACQADSQQEASTLRM